MIRTTVAFVLGLFIISSAQALEPEQQAPEFKLSTINGSHVESLKAHLGEVVYVDFWASWCGPCRKSFPVMQQLQDEYGKQGFTILAISTDEDMDDARRFADKMGVKFTLLDDHEGNTPEAYGVEVMPTSFLLDRSGKVRLKRLGFYSHEIPSLRAEIETLLKQK